jgi:hypothetical protein
MLLSDTTIRQQPEKHSVADRTTKEPQSVILKFRMQPTRAELLEAIAETEKGGNVSDLLRDLAERKIAARFPNHALPEYAA